MIAIDPRRLAAAHLPRVSGRDSRPGRLPPRLRRVRHDARPRGQEDQVGDVQRRAVEATGDDGLPGDDAGRVRPANQANGGRSSSGTWTPTFSARTPTAAARRR
jgi:hypothetical protein